MTNNREATIRDNLKTIKPKEVKEIDRHSSSQDRARNKADHHGD
jgi:hypothetical protein